MTLKQQFKEAIQCGTGAAYFIMKNHPDVDFSDIIIDAALINYAYDAQSEGSRSEYIFELLSLSNRQEKIRNAILHGLAVADEQETWALLQLFQLAKIFAEQGDEYARDVIYTRFLENKCDKSDWLGAYEIIDLDGMDGFIAIATTIGQRLQRHPEDWEDDDLISYFQLRYPAINAWEQLAKLAKTDISIKLYLDKVNESRTSLPDNNTQETPPETSFIQEIIDGKPLTALRCQQLSDSEVEAIAHTFLNEKKPLCKELLLPVFSFRKFPLAYECILELAKKKASGNSRLVEFAIDALQHISAPDIRAFAIEKIKTSNTPYKYVNILSSNYKAGDSVLLTQIINQFKNRDIIEQLAHSLIAIYTTNKTRECAEPLTALYGKMTCGLCRKKVVGILHDNNVLPDTIKAELRYDSYIDIRNLVLSQR